MRDERYERSEEASRGREDRTREGRLNGRRERGVGSEERREKNDDAIGEEGIASTGEGRWGEGEGRE